MDRGDILSMTAVLALIMLATAVSDWRDTRTMYEILRESGWSRWIAGTAAAALLIWALTAFVVP